ncbi:hypothetical protein KC19_3G241200 [Ceratodon purpureus]|uniref:F-box/kelch-repeat protein n=1 Tax=Ceratodon purpureus TaxID=3225 RepID=A0A8T0IPY9_CERPU|nr:hypothetical protein KC19_3G241200 [Ceratodon purpureus]
MERQSEVREEKRSRTGKRRLSSSSSSSGTSSNANVDVEMATATLSVPKEPSRSYSRTPRRSNHKKKKGVKKDAAAAAAAQRSISGGEGAEPSAVEPSPSPEANRGVNPPVVDASESSTRADVPDGAIVPGNEGATVAGSPREADAPLIPGLSDTLALYILALVPLSYHQPLKGVCRKWRRFLSSSTGTGNEVLEMRKVLGVKETWVFLLASGGQQRHPQWRAFDPVFNRWRCLPQCPCDYTFDSCDKESAVAGTQLLVTGHSATGPTVWRYDLHTNEWGKAAKMIKNRCLFASASHGNYAYFAGGSADGAVLKSAERYNSHTEEWEPLPDLHVNRKWCSGCILDNKFFVIGGQGSERQSLTSGEYYDEAEKRWVTVENMWPAARTQSPGQTAPPLVAVVKDQLYAADASTMELNSYHKGTNTWRPLGPVPSRSVDSSGWGMGFKAVRNEIFVIGGSSDRGNGTFCDQIHAWPPSPNVGGWREVGQLPNTSGFIYNCAVMII